MSDTHYERVKQIYYESAALEPAERSAYIGEACNGDDSLREELLALFDAEVHAGSFLEQPALSRGALHDVVMQSLENAAPGPLPERIGRYRILHLLGEGGMGSVYEAEQESPRRHVALKVLRSGSLQPRSLQRFQREVEVLGRLQHPGIARIYDADIAEMIQPDGRSSLMPYFAMELIEGLAITKYAESRGLAMRDRLALLADACDAVHFGHQHGVVHRDLKPANVLVAQRPALQPVPHGPVVKIIDFGVARVAESDIASSTLATEAGQIIGTLAYMSPEQVGGNPLEIDSRCDIYGLGVVGFELLTGRLPYEIADKIAPEAARVIRDEEPSRLSSISRIYRGDIETIFAKSLEKDPAQRYDSAAALAADIRRYLNDEPIVARPPTLHYQLAKFAKRHKEFVAGLALVFLVLVAGIVGTSITLVQAVKQQRAADLARTSADAAAAHAREQTQKAQAAGANAERARMALQRLFENIQPGTPDGGRDLRVVDMLDANAESILAELAESPETELSLRRTLGQTYARLGEEASATRHFMRALEIAARLYGNGSVETYDLAAEMALARVWKGEAADRDRLRATADGMEKMIAEVRPKIPAGHPTLQRMLFAAARLQMRSWNAAKSLEHLRELEQSCFVLPAEARVFSELQIQAEMLTPLFFTEINDAEAMALKVIDAARDRPGPIAMDASYLAQMTLGGIYSSTQRLQDADRTLRQLLESQRSALGDLHPTTGATAIELVNVLLREGRLEDAREAYAIERRRCEQRDPKGEWLHFLESYEGILLGRQGRIDEARPWFTKAVAGRRASDGDDDMLAQEWWRAGCMAIGGFTQPWSCDTLQRVAYHLVSDMLTTFPTSTFDLDECDWSKFQFTIELWNGAAREIIQIGDLNLLRRLSDLPEGLYRMRVTLPRNGQPLKSASYWFLVAPWQLELTRTYMRIDEPEKVPSKKIGPVENRDVPSVVFDGDYFEQFGPLRAPLAFMITGNTEFQIPAGDYQLLVHADDGIRVWLDGQQVVDAWRGREGPSHAFTVDSTLQPGRHSLRLEYFQIGQASTLWVLFRPKLPAASGPPLRTPPESQPDDDS